MKGACVVRTRTCLQDACENRNLATILIVFSRISPDIADFFFEGLPRGVCSHFRGLLAAIGAANFLLNTPQRHWVLDDFIIISVEVAVGLADEWIGHFVATWTLSVIMHSLPFCTTHSASFNRANSDMILSCAV